MLILLICFFGISSHFNPERTPILRRSAEEDFVIIGPSKRYFQFESGDAFFPIGHNEWPSQIDPRFNSNDTIDKYFKNFAENGGTALRVICDSLSLPVEMPAGVFNPDFKNFMDIIFEMAEKYDFYLMISHWSNVFNVPVPSGFWFSWYQHPYNSKNGGPCEYFTDLFTLPASLELQEGRIRYFVDNWGHSKRVFSWEMANEFNNKNNMWINRMGAYIKKIEQEKFGKSHLRTISVTASSVGDSDWAQWNSPHLDFATFHSYGKDDFQKPKTCERIAIHTLNIPNIIQRVVDKINTTKPVYDCEVPAIGRGSIQFPYTCLLNDTQLIEGFGTFSWAYMASGAASNGMRFASHPPFIIDDHKNALSPEMYQYQLAAKKFSDMVKWNKMIDPSIYNNITVDPKFHCFATCSGDINYCVGWLFYKTDAGGKVKTKLSFNGLSSGSHRFIWVDDFTGDVLATHDMKGSDFEVQSPEFLGHIGFYMEVPSSESSAGIESRSGGKTSQTTNGQVALAVLIPLSFVGGLANCCICVLCCILLCFCLSILALTGIGAGGIHVYKGKIGKEEGFSKLEEMEGTDLNDDNETRYARHKQKEEMKPKPPQIPSRKNPPQISFRKRPDQLD